MQDSEKSAWPPFIIMNSIMVITWLVTHVFHRKRLKELARLSQV